MEPDEHGTWKDIVFLLMAAGVHGIILSSDPGLGWARAPERAPAPVPIEFVASAPSTLLAPMPPTEGDVDQVPAHGPGEYQPEKVKKGSPDAVPEDRPLTPEELARRREERARARTKRAEASLKRKLARAENRRARALALAERRRRIEERQAATARAKAVREERRAEIERQLAMLPEPDERLSDAVASPAPAEAAGNGPDAATMPDPVFDPSGKGGRSERDLAPAGGGPIQEGGGVGWSLEGPVGSRRILERRLPSCPDWVSERDLDLTVQIRFRVLADGTIKRGRVIQRTSGFPEIDRLALKALNRWRFEPVQGHDGSETPDTWGVVTLRFRAG